MLTNDQYAESAIFDALEGGIIVLDLHERIVNWNAWMTSASGQSFETVYGKTLSEIFPGLMFRRLASAIKLALESGASTGISNALNSSPLPLRTRSRRKLLHDIKVSPIGSSPITACLVFITDVTMATHREQYLRDQQKARYNAVVESAPDVIITIDGAGCIQMANPAAVSQFGYTLNELTGKDAAILFDERSDWPTTWRTAVESSTPVQSKELIAIHKDGSLSYVEASASRWNIGARALVTVILRNITERRAINLALRASEAAARNSAAALADLNQSLEQRVEQRTAQLMNAEEALRQSQKMEAIGQLTGGIAHDFNNLLQGITGSLHVTQKLIALGRIGETDRFLKAAIDSAYRAASLTHRLLAFSRQQPIDPRPLNVNELITSMEELLRRTIGETVQMNFTAADSLWLIRCDANQLENAILNLAINARDAMPDGGTLTIEMSNKILDSAEAALRELQPGEHVRLIVKDTGEGMPAEVRARVFEPFFTTKAIGKGTGLGLSMIYGFVKQSNGSVLIESEVGKGTSIEVCLPRYQGNLDVEATDETNPRESRAGLDEVVLVVEDEGVVRLLVVEVLKELGYYALEAQNGASAVQILESRQRIDLLITDLGLPDISGNEVARIGIANRKNLKVLFMTGYAEKAASNSFLQEGMEIITKPFPMDLLAERIRSMIETR
ncbi:MAG: PAS domain S-box protein [Pseudomonadota bacterium]